MERLLQDGDWKHVKSIRKPKPVKSGRLRDSAGRLVESSEWAETMADHLERVQWKVRPAGVVDGPVLGEELPVCLASFTLHEVSDAARQLKKERASGLDTVPAEFWQAVGETEEGLINMTDLCNQCWREEAIPDDWHTASVTSVFKKGSAEDCSNYRPISLVCVAYKLFATLLSRRLKGGGAERRLTPTQFGFRSGHGSNDAIFGVRRLIDLALAQRSGKICMLALDWKQSFDSINIGALSVALRRFGVPPKMLRMIEHIYSVRRFRVKDGDSLSSERLQRSGISQGCPLSPFLFVILMTVVMEDSIGHLSDHWQNKARDGSLQALLYADDTLLLGFEEAGVQRLLEAVALVGGRYGMELHWSKFQLLGVNHEYRISAPDGTRIVPKDMMAYLGATVYSDGSVSRELGRKLGAAWGEFSKLNRLWKHTTLAATKKIRILQAVVVSRLLYGLSSAWLNKSEVRRLNGFYCRCLRVILRISPAYVSRVSNVTVLQRAGQTELRLQLLTQQLLLYGRVVRLQEGHPMRQWTFCPNSQRPKTDQYVRRVGRPRNEWTRMMQIESQKVCTNSTAVIHNEFEWRRRVIQHSDARGVAV